MKPAPTPRVSLISDSGDYGILWTGELQRHHAIWNELTYHLRIDTQPNAISVLFRVLLEFSLDHYIQVHDLEVHENDKLAKRVQKVGDALLHHKIINKKQLGTLKKFGQTEPLFSADTLNKYVHDSDFTPSPEHLKALWDTMSFFIVACLKG